MPTRTPQLQEVNAASWQTIQGPCAISIGAVANENPSGLNATRASAGLTDSGVELSFSIETVKLTSDQLLTPHSTVEISRALLVTLSLDQSSIWNLALAMSYDQDVVSGSSMLVYDSQQPAPYRCVRIENEGARNDPDDVAVTEYTDLWKAKVAFASAAARGKTVKTTLPITIHAVANANDEVGATLVNAKMDRPLYEAILFIVHDLWTGDTFIITNLSVEFRLLYISLSASTPLANNVTVSLDTVFDDSYNTILYTFRAGAADYLCQFDEGAVFEKGDNIVIAGNIGANICYCTIGYTVDF